jgi:hypothetical protein
VVIITTVYVISDYTTSKDYAERMKEEGYQIEELNFSEKTPYEFILLEGC